jgi:hypothetical protein
VTLAKDEVAILRDIAHNITSSGKEVNLWEMMNAINATIRDRFYETPFWPKSISDIFS